MKLNQKVYELYKLNSEGKKVTALDIRRDDNILLVINGICTDIKIDLLFEEISKKFGNVIKGYSVLQNFGLVVDKETREGFLIDKKENRLSLFNPITNENIFFDNIKNPFIQMGDININKETEDRYISILQRAYSQVLDEEIKETTLPITNERITNEEKSTENNKSEEKEEHEEIEKPENKDDVKSNETKLYTELTIEQIEQDFKDDGWNINKDGDLMLLIKDNENPILANISNDEITELEFISSENDTEAGIIYKFKNGEHEIDISLKNGKITILETETVGEHS